MWLQCGGRPHPALPAVRKSRYSRRFPRCSRSVPDGKKTATKALTRLQALAYIATTHGAPPLGAMTRLCEAPHLCKVASPDAKSGREASTALRSRRGGTLAVPGCLTGESEERETWTAESLRAASSENSVLGSKELKYRAWRRGGRTRLRRYTFQVNTNAAMRKVWCGASRSMSVVRGEGGTSSNVVISRDKFSSKLESLILAQSERWRQA
jgi:hypothetical protein